MRPPVIQVENLGKAFNDKLIVQGVTFQIEVGQIFGFIGPSGSGKTTTVRLLTGIYQPSLGQATVLGDAPINFRRTTREKIGYMPQLFALYPDLTAWENLNFAASIYGMSLFQRKDRLYEMLDFVELREHKDKLARNMSGGMQRRLSLAASMVHKPDLLFLDEPTAGIDPVLRRKFWDHFKTLQADGRTLFITTQYVGEATHCDYVGIMVEGRLIVVDTPDGLRHQAFGGEMINLRLQQPPTPQQLALLHDFPLTRPDCVTPIDDTLVRLVVSNAATAIPELLHWSDDHSLDIESVEEYLPPFDDVFVELVNQANLQ